MAILPVFLTKEENLFFFFFSFRRAVFLFHKKVLGFLTAANFLVFLVCFVFVKVVPPPPAPNAFPNFSFCNLGTFSLLQTSETIFPCLFSFFLLHLKTGWTWVWESESNTSGSLTFHTPVFLVPIVLPT